MRSRSFPPRSSRLRRGTRRPAAATRTPAADLTPLEAPLVESGHVAAWVGVGGPNDGPDGTAVWLQAGLVSLPGGGSRLYYEYVRPGIPVTYVDLGAGTAVHVAVLKGRAGWRVWVNGEAVSEPIALPGSSRLTPVATAESFDGCNSYAFRFDGLRVARATGGVWRPFVRHQVRQDAGQQVTRSASSFVATGGGVRYVSNHG